MSSPLHIVSDRNQQSEHILQIVRSQSEQLKALADIYSTEMTTSILLNDINTRLDVLEIIVSQLAMIHARVMMPWYSRLYSWFRQLFP